MCIFVGCRGLLVLSIAVACCWTAEGMTLPDENESPSSDDDGLVDSDELPCMHDYKVVLHGQRKDLTDCSFCICDNSTLICQFEACQPLRCSGSQRVKTEGVCCGVCDFSVPPSDLPCVRNGQIVLHGRRQELSDCSFCVCDNSTLICQFETCPRLSCSYNRRIKVEGECCEVCDYDVIVNDLPCMMHNGQMLLHGDRSRLSECSFCDCDNSTLNCMFDSCPPLSCSQSQAIKVEGKCCRICPKDLPPSDLPCMRKGRHLNHGEREEMTDCSFCVCDNSTLRCHFKTCPPHTCSQSQEIKIKGKCCKVCRNNVIVNDLPCMYNGKSVLHGEREELTDCSYCVCDNSTLRCHFKTCPPHTCSQSQEIKIKGKCCKVCRNNVIVNDLPCMYNGKSVLHGEREELTDCSYCVCDNSTLRCQFETCPPLTCSSSQRIKVEGECCKICTNTSMTPGPEDVDGDVGISETSPSTDSSLDTLLLQVEQDRLKIERDNLAETRKMNKHFSDLISILETQ